MWCTKCHAGSKSWVVVKCNICGSTDITEKNPFEGIKHPRTLHRRDKVSTRPTSESEKEFIDTRTKGHLQGVDYARGQ